MAATPAAEAIGAIAPVDTRDTERAMGERDEEIIARLRRFFEAFNRGDFDAATEIAHLEIEFVRGMGQPPLKGADAFRGWMEPDAFEENVIEPLDFRIQGDKVLVPIHIRARGAGSGIEVAADGWAVWTLNDDGLVTRLEAFLDHQEAEALEAAGLRR